jgi:hypothetical protein
MTTKDKFLCFADVGTKVRLEEEWNFALYNEYRNKSLGLLLCEDKWKKAQNTWPPKPIDFITLPAGTELAIERVYIRAQLGDFSSITFRVTKIDDPRFFGPGKGTNKDKTVLKKARFWAKLADVNEGCMKIVDDKGIDLTQGEIAEYDIE